MEFEFELTKDEMVAFDKVVHDRIGAMAKAAIGGWKFFAVNVIAAGLAVALMTGSHIYKRKLIEKAVYLRDGWLGAQLMVADEVGITVTSPGSSAQLSWALVREVIEDEATLYLFFNLSHALVLPKRVFRSGEELDQLRRWAQQREVKL